MPAAMWDMNRTRLTSRNGDNTRPNMATGYSYSIKGGPAPPRPPREFVDSQFETAPPVREPPPRNPKRNLVRNPNFEILPSIHSQHHPTANVYAASRALHRQQDMETISPPSSPEPTYGRRPGQQTLSRQRNREVSPLDEERHVAVPAPRSASRTGGTFQGSVEGQHSRSNIPMMRRARRKQSDAALRETQSRERLATTQPSDQHKGEVRWDAMTGEPTASVTGRPPQVRPAEYAQGLGITTASPPQQRSPTAVMTAFGDRVRRMAHTGKGDRKPERVEDHLDPAVDAFASSRPGWRGASGRTAIVEPVRDNLQVAPLRIPPKNTRRVVSPTSATSPTSNQILGRSMRGQTPPVSPPGTETVAESRPRESIRKAVPSSQVATPADSKRQSDGPSYPSPPHSASFDESNAPAVAAKQLKSSITGGDVTSTPDLGHQNSQQQNQPMIHRKPHPAHTHQESVSSVYSQASQPSAPQTHSVNPNTLAPGDPWVQPPSRFSITTYATSAANTPRESFDDFDQNRPPVPETPEQYRESPQPHQDSVMDRRRPEPYGRDDRNVLPSGSPVNISLKDKYMSQAVSTPPSAAAQQRKAAATGGHQGPALDRMRARTAVERPISIASSINKSLPPAPPETSADQTRDRVAMINAQLQGLGNRRINITRSIKQMTELMPTDSILDSAEVVHKREMEKRKVEALRRELSEVQREEYELGLKLHRAYKRMDRDLDYEPTTLWVRRVTG